MPIAHSVVLVSRVTYLLQVFTVCTLYLVMVGTGGVISNTNILYLYCTRKKVRSTKKKGGAK